MIWAPESSGELMSKFLAGVSNSCPGRGKRLENRRKSLGPAFAFRAEMSSLENIYLKMSPTMEPATLAHLHHDASHANGQRLIGRDVAHELNNILTIIRGYADRMLLKHGDHPVMRQELQLIAENAKRAETVIRNSARANAGPVMAAAMQPTV